MKKIIIAFVAISAGLFSYGQNTTNIEGSSYSFTKIAHLDATPVLSQGYTGTCWSFSALSFFESEMIRKGIKNPPILSQMYVARKADRKSTRLNSSHVRISYAVFCLKKKIKK